MYERIVEAGVNVGDAKYHFPLPDLRAQGDLGFLLWCASLSWTHLDPITSLQKYKYTQFITLQLLFHGSTQFRNFENLRQM